MSALTRTLRAARSALFLAAAALSSAAPAASREPSDRLGRISDAITEIDLETANKLLSELGSDAPSVGYESARFSVYRGECAVAAATLSRPELAESKEGAGLKALAESCARATAAGVVIEDAERGIWLRLQDDADRALAPLIFDVADKARRAVTQAVGVDLPRPLRIDLVRDLFSLSAVSGLPLTAAETTGTLAVARWGRVILLSPRAAQLGFPWEDTLAHEITHLVVTRATRDHAPLWLQEGMAKRLESTWRDPRPFDEPEWAETLATRALLEGRSVGIDHIGPSIAMLPTPEAATIAFAEVTSFVSFFTRDAGKAALHLLFADLRGSGEHGADVALRSITGYDLTEWNRRWQKSLLTATAKGERTSPHRALSRDLARRARLSDLLLERGHARAAADQLPAAAMKGLGEPALRYRSALAWLEVGDAAQARSALGAEAEITSVHGPWYAVNGRLLRDSGDPKQAESAFDIAIAGDPLNEVTACEGRASARKAVPPATAPPLPSDPVRRELCRSARERPRD